PTSDGISDRGRGATIHVGEGLDERLLVTERRAAAVLRNLGEVVVAATEDLLRLVDRLEDQFIRMFLEPLQAALRAPDANVEVVLVAAGNLRSEQDAFRAALEAHEAVAVIVERASGDEGREVGANLVDRQAGDVTREV